LIGDCLKIYWYFFPYLTILHAPVAAFGYNQTGLESRHNGGIKNQTFYFMWWPILTSKFSIIK